MIFQRELMSSLRLHAQRTAIEYNQGKVRYEELASMAEKITHALLSQRLPPETTVGVQLSDRVSQIACMIGIMNARCAFVLLDPAIPAKRFELINKDLQLKWIIAAGVTDVPEGAVCLQLDKLMAAANGHSFDMPAYEEDDSIYVYFTSGSTGVPKGIIGRNKSLLQFVRWEISAFDIDQDCRVSQFISPYFDASLRDVFVPLLTGGTLCIPPPSADFFTPGPMKEWIGQTGITLIHCVPSIFRVFGSGDLIPALFPRLKHVLMSGEKINPSELESWYNVFTDRIQLVNFYGATETTMIRAYYPIRPSDVNLARIPIGKPIADTTLLVLTRDMKPCAPLVAGDLYIVSDYISKGYLNNPTLTNEVFVLIDVPGTGLKPAYKTGDRARTLPDGNTDLLGREDRQVKLRGLRIELDEVERVIAGSGMTRQAAVIMYEEKNGNASLLAFVVPATDPGPDFVKRLQTYMEAYLPAYSMPGGIYPIETLPLLPNGKINYNGLPAFIPKATIVPPDNATEKTLLEVWKEILGDRELSTDESFLRSGGNSLGIMRLVGRIFNDFKVRVSLNDIFNNPTIRQQARLIQQAGKSELYIIREAGRKAWYRVSSTQQRIYFNYELNKERTSYNLPMAWEFNGTLDIPGIERLFSRLISRHEGLRSRFVNREGELVQEILPEVDFKMERFQEQQGNLDMLIENFIRPFDLAQAPLFRVAVVKTERGGDVILADLHHIICDGMSQQILRSDFEALYAGLELQPLKIHYKDYAEWEHRFRETEDFISQRAFWLRQFEKEVPGLQLPTSGDQSGDLSDLGGNIHFKISRKQLQPLIDHLQQEELTLFTGIFSLYFVFVAQLSGQEDIVIGVTSSGRSQIELENVVGMFVKMLPVRYQIDPDASLEQLIASLHQYMVQATSNQYFDLADIIAALNSSRSVPVRNLFEVAFVHGNFDHSKQQAVIRNDAFSPYVFENKNSKFPITLYVGENEDSFSFRLEYAHAYFSPADAQALAEQFRLLAIQLSGAPGKPLTELLRNTDQKAGVVDEDILFNF